MSAAPIPGLPLLEQTLLTLIRRTSADLPTDVRRALAAAQLKEDPGSRAVYALQVVQDNIVQAEQRQLPLCQDTGTLIFHVHHGPAFDTLAFREAASRGVAQATKLGYLRQNSVDSLTGRNSGNNLGPGSPVFHLHPSAEPGDTEVRLMLKGGGCENVGAQYSLPDSALHAGRDLEGVRRVVLDAVVRAQGQGCAPGVLGVCIGGDRATGYEHSKEVLLRPLDDVHPDPALARLEATLLEQANTLDIGPMGFGGRTTLLGCKIGYLNRLPASYFVSISYMCWAYRRQGVRLGRAGELLGWLY